MSNPYNDWAILAAFIFIYSIIAGRLERTWLSGAIVFTAFGLLCGPFGLGILHLNVNSENFRAAILILAISERSA